MSRAEVRAAVAADEERRSRRWSAVSKIANVILDDSTIKVNRLDVTVSQVNGLREFMAYVQIDATLVHEPLAHLMKLGEIYEFTVVVLSRHDGEGRYNFRLWPK